jgi:hypothetical protein
MAALKLVSLPVSFLWILGQVMLLSGMRVDDTAPLVTWQNGQGRINDVSLYVLNTWCDDLRLFAATACGWK